MKVKDLINRLQQYEDDLEMVFVCNDCATEYGFEDVKLIEINIHKDLDNNPVQLLLEIN